MWSKCKPDVRSKQCSACTSGEAHVVYIIYWVLQLCLEMACHSAGMTVVFPVANANAAAAAPAILLSSLFAGSACSA
jgi:hypothetical protein